MALVMVLHCQTARVAESNRQQLSDYNRHIVQVRRQETSGYSTDVSNENATDHTAAANSTDLKTPMKHFYGKQEPNCIHRKC